MDDVFFHVQHIINLLAGSYRSFRFYIDPFVMLYIAFYWIHNVYMVYTDKAR